jgi:hypothetical protein
MNNGRSQNDRLDPVLGTVQSIQQEDESLPKPRLEVQAEPVIPEGEV